MRAALSVNGEGARLQGVPAAYAPENLRCGCRRLRLGARFRPHLGQRRMRDGCAY